MKKVVLMILAICFTTGVFAQIADSAKRKVNLQGAVNFRDLGGYATKDGKHVKWGKVYRSADMSKLTDADLADLAKRQVKYDVDLRGRQESAQSPDKLNKGTDYILCPAGSDSISTTMMRDLSKTKNGDSLMVAFYSNTTYLTDRYKPFFQKLLAVPDNDALVFHCTAGKDRTGMGAALFLYSLGVPYNTIINDYTATNYYRKDASVPQINAMVAMMHVDKSAAQSMMMAKKEYLDATFAAIKKKYGSVDSFLTNQIGLTPAQIKTLKQKYLQ